jgi:hypothetical protein
MFSYPEQLDTVKQLHLNEGDHKTMNCPFCGGHKKFTVSKLLDGTILWNCFKASCNAKGRHSGNRSIQAAKNYVSGNLHQERKTRYVPIPAITTNPATYPAAIEYLQTVNSLTAMENGLIKIRYAPKEHRVLFYNQDQTGAVGRLIKGDGPKWMSYGDVSTGIHVKNGPTAVIVEDAASACSVARLDGTTGVAILGTHLTNTIINALHSYAKVYMVLDNDASRKAVSEIKKIRGNVNLRFTGNDLKVLTIDQLNKTLRTNNNNNNR